jgi:hypothetical protein
MADRSRLAENDNAVWSEEVLALYRRAARQRQRSLIRRVGFPHAPPIVAESDRKRGARGKG